MKNFSFINFLPPWVETNIQPAFYDKESGTVLQQTARMYAKVNQLVRHFNCLSKETKETVDEYIAKFVELKDFVDTYFENLDVQDEINNKLDQMTEDGTLQEIIGDYLNATAVWGFDTVADMQDATNLINGSYAKTLGFHAKNDGGEATYKIRNVTNDDVIDGASIIEMNDAGNQLVAELIITEPINVKTFGAYGDDTHDDTQAIQRAIDFGFASGNNVIYLPDGTYKITNPIYLLEKMTFVGENTANTIIHKVGNGAGDKAGLQKDAIIILADSTYGTGTTVSYDKRTMQTIKNMRLQGDVESYTQGKSESELQYAIWCIGYAPKLTIDSILINKVDCGIYAVGSYISKITNIKVLEAFYDGINITTESQGTLIQNINTMFTHRYGIKIAGATYGSIQATLVEWTYGGEAYYLSNWHGDMTGCGYELGDGPNVGIHAIDSEIRLTGGYFYSGTPTGVSGVMLSISGSSVTVSNSVFGTYGVTDEYNGKMAGMYNGKLIIDDNNKFYCTFSTDSSSSGYGFITVNGKTYDVVRDIVYQQSSDKSASDEFDYIDSKFNSTKKHPRCDIYFGNINTPMSNPISGYSDWGPAYNKGDIGFFKNALPAGKAGWICNRDNHSDLQQSNGTITDVTGSTITLSDIKTENYTTTGIRFYVGAKIKGVTSSATGRITSISGNALTLSGISGTFQTNEKIQLVSENFWTYGDYLYIPIINAGPTTFRPTQNMVIGQMYFDTTLNKPIWFKGSNTWVDATGATV